MEEEVLEPGSAAAAAAAAEEEAERKLLADTSEDEALAAGLGDDDDDNEPKLGDEVLESDEDERGGQLPPADGDDDSESDDDSDSDSDSEAAEDEESRRNEAELKLIEESLAASPYDYEAHRRLIDKLREMCDFDRLRTAREDMSSKYPLTPELWLAWLRDEMKLAITTEQKAAVIDICERAIQDYLSVEVWLEYLQFTTGLGTDKETTEKIRNVFERALTAAGLHVMKGALIWDAFREFENFIVIMLDSDDPEAKEQVNRIGKLYRRQLSCPLLGMEKTYEEYKLWRSAEGTDCTEDEKIIKSGYERALLQLTTRLPFEEKLESVQNKEEQLDAYKVYLTKEKQIGDPGRVSVLYERAIADLSLEPSLWVDYVEYLENSIKIEDIIEKVYLRAVRNVPWCVKIWQKWIRFYEKNNRPLLEIQKLIENAFNTGFSNSEEYRNLWMTYLEYLRRKIDDKDEDEKKQLEILRNSFNKACEHLASFGLEGDPSCEILQFWARVEAVHANDMERTRSLWADIMSQGHSESAASWLEYISLERCYGDTKHLRKLFQKALTAVKDWPESIANAWMNFERDEGTLEQMEICEAKTKERLDKVAEERQKMQQYSTTHEEVSVSKKTGKRKMDDSGKWKNLGASTAKISKVERPSKEKENNKIEKNKSPGKETNNTAKPKIAPPPGFKADNPEPMEEDSSHSFDEVDEKITVFISNLDYTATEEEIREVLKPIGPITLFRLVQDYKGRSKGFGYVQLSSPEAVEEALKLDRVRVNGRPMYISKCDPNKTSRNTFKYKTVLEKNKLFIKGLPPTTTKEQLEEMFKVHGNLKDVRIVTYRNGHSKGIAYVDFEDETSAAKAVVATDGMTIEDKIISVAISQPPPRKYTPGADDLAPPPIKSLGGSSTSRTGFGHQKTILSLIPRSIKSTTSITNSKNGDSVAGNGVSQPMSNADFKNMLLKK